jgi:hypothetical protein
MGHETRRLFPSAGFRLAGRKVDAATGDFAGESVVVTFRVKAEQ